MNRINDDFYFTVDNSGQQPKMEVFNSSYSLLFTWTNVRVIQDQYEQNDTYRKMALSFFNGMPKKWYQALLKGIEPYRALSRNIRCENGCVPEYIAVTGGVIKKCRVCLSTL